MKILFSAIVIMMGSVIASAQGSYVAIPVQTGNGQAIAGANVALCSAKPTTVTACGGTTLQQTYTDITLATSCMLNPPILGPTFGVGCTNPGMADGFGMARIYASPLAGSPAGFLYYQAYGQGILVPDVEPILFPGGGGGGGGGIALVQTGDPTQITVANGSTVPVITLANNTALPGTPTASGIAISGNTSTGTLNISTSLLMGGQTVTGIGGNSGILATLGSVTGNALACVIGGNVTTTGCAAPVASAAGVGSENQFRNVGTGLLQSDPLAFYTLGTHTQTLQNVTVNGQMNFAQPYAISTSIPSVPACAPATVGTSQFCINSDGQFATQVNGGPLSDLGGGGGNVSTNPVGSQAIVQPAGSTFSANSFGNITYVTPSDNWSQSPSGTITVGANTVTLNPCPRGIFVNTPLYYGTSTTPTFVYLATQGTPEAVLVTSTTCTQQGGATGTITFTAVNTHAAGYTVGTASQGVQEAINAASYVGIYGTGGMELGRTVVIPQQTTWKARVTLSSPGMVLDFGGAYVTCTMADTCLYIGSSVHTTYVWDATVENVTFQPGCNNCNFPAIEDNAQHTRLLSIGAANAVPLGTYTSGSSFGSLIQVDNDQAAVIDSFSSYGARWSHCDTTFCSVAIKGAGGGGNSGILYISNANMNLGCGANGVDNQNSNTMRISNSVIQSQAQFAVRATSSFGNVPSVELDEVYQEVSGCAGSNPLHVGIAGLIVESGFATIHNSTGPTGASELFANTGATQYNYYIVAHTTTSSATSPPYLAGIALTNGVGSIVVKWPQFGTTGTITYDVIRTSGPANSPAPYSAVCTGGATTTCGSIATGLTVGGACAAVGSTNICSFTDTASTNTANYTVVSPSTYWPALPFWSGAIVYTTSGDIAPGTGPISGGVYMDRYGDNVTNLATNPANQSVSSFGALLPKFFAQHCNGSSVYGGIWVSCGENADASNVGAILLQAGGYNSSDAFGLKGKLIFENGLVGTSIKGGHKLTLVDSNAVKTLNTVSMRPSYDANDTWIGLDNTSTAVTPAFAQLAFGAPVSISNYIGNVGDNTSFLERLTATAKTFNVPVTLGGTNSLTVGGGLTVTGNEIHNGTVQENAAVTVNAALQVNGNINGYRPSLIKTINFTVPATQSGTIFNNIGAAGTVIFTLPACSTNGLNYGFYIDAVQTLEILAVGGAKFRNLATLGAANGNIQAATQGNAIHIQCIGTSGTDGVAEWIVDTIQGTWAVN